MDPLAPTRARYKVIVFGVILAAIQYVDRICIAKAAPKISADLHFDADQMAWIFAAFTIAYALFEIPTGWMGDKFGTRKTLVRRSEEHTSELQSRLHLVCRLLLEKKK